MQPVAAVPVNDHQDPPEHEITDLSALWEAAATPSVPAADTTSQETPERITGSIHNPAASGTESVKVYSNGVISFAGTLFSVTRVLSNRVIIADWDPNRIVFATTIGEVIAEFAWPPRGPQYQGITKARYRFQNKPKEL